jgi:hypothetical protein
MAKQMVRPANSQQLLVPHPAPAGAGWYMYGTVNRKIQPMI